MRHFFQQLNCWHPSNGNKTILIAGGCGFIGSYFTKLFLELGYKVLVVDDLSTGSLDNLPKHPNLIFEKFSVLDLKKVKTLPPVHFVVHLASVVGMKLAKSNHTLAYDTSTIGTKNILENTGNAPVLSFSSSAVYGIGSTSNKMSEKHLVSSDDLFDYDGGKYGYAMGKWELENIVMSHASVGRKVLICRPFNIVGVGQVGSFGMVVPSFINQAIAGDPVTVYGDGEQGRCFSEINTFVKSVINLIVQEEAWQTGGNIINIGSDTSTTINEIAKMVIEKTASTSEITHIPFADIYPGQQDVLNRIPDTSLSETWLGKINWPTMSVIIDSCLLNTNQTIHA